MQHLIKIITSVSLFFVIIAPRVHAHSSGLPVFKINGKLVETYQVQEFREDIFDLPLNTDYAPDFYLVNQPVTFEFTSTDFMGSLDVVKKTDFTWDFGDGTQSPPIASVAASTHTYNKIGTHVLKVYADYASAGFPDVGKQLVQSIIIHILPNKEYKLPQPVIRVNGQAAPGIGKGALQFNLEKKLIFDARSSKPGTAKITAYAWDLHFGKTANSSVIEHAYTKDQTYVSPILRVTDENGFFQDTLVDLQNVDTVGETLNENSPTQPPWLKIILYVNAVLLIVFGIIWVIRAFKK